MGTKHGLFLLLFILISNSCIKVNYRLIEMSQDRQEIVLHYNEATDVDFDVRGTWLRESDRITLTVENLPVGMAYEVKPGAYSSSSDQFAFLVNFKAGTAKGGIYNLRVVATEEKGGRTERMLKVTISPYTINDLMIMKYAYDTVFDAVSDPATIMQYATNVTPDFDNVPTGVVFSKLGTIVDAQGFLFSETYAQLDTITGKIILFENDLATRKLTSGEGFIKDIGYGKFVEINYVTTNTTNNTHKNGKVILRKN